MRQFKNWQFTKGAVDAPQEYIDYVLCAHVYHCTPSDLDAQSALTTSLHLEFWNDEMKQRSGKKRTIQGKSKRRGSQKHARNPNKGQ